MDIVYPLKRSRQYEELRYSLRSVAANLEHDRVFIIGGKPDWLSDEAIHLHAAWRPQKHQDLRENVLAACKDPRVSDPFILFNDDFFVMHPMKEVPVLNRGTSRETEQSIELQRDSNPLYLQAMIYTREVLESQGYKDPLCFELHVPMVVHKKLMIKAYNPARLFPRWHNRTAYGAYAGLTGETIKDVKVYSKSALPDLSSPFLSTNDGTFRDGVVGKHIRNRFTAKSPYER